MKYAIYCRISRDSTGQQAGLERQEKECLEYAERHGLEVAEVYADNDISAYSGKQRPAWNRLLADIKSGRIQGLLVWNIDRAYRRSIDLQPLIDLTQDHGLQVRTVVAGDLDLSTPTGRMIARVVADVASFEVENNRDRILASHRSRSQKGSWRTGRAPYGYFNSAPGEISIDKHESSVVKEAAEKVLAGESLLSVVRDLNDREITTKTGKKWRNVTLRQVLLNPSLAALSTHKGQVVGQAAWEPIFSLETHEQLKTTLTDPSRLTNQGTTRATQGAGVYLCGKCGERLRNVRARTVKGKPRAYACPGWHVQVSQEDLDDYVSREVIAHLQTVLESRETVESEDGPSLHDLTEERNTLLARHDRLGELFAAGTITEAQLVGGTSTIQSELQALDQRITELAKESPLKRLALPNMVLGVVYEYLNPDQRADLIRSVATVTVHPVGKGSRKVRVEDRATITLK